MLHLIRQIFHAGAARIREAAVCDLAEALGYARVGSRIREVLLTDLLTAVRRGILQNVRGLLSLDWRTIEEYPRDFLKTQFLAAIGAAWTAREEASTRFARWLGFARTGPVIAETARSLINGLARQGRLARNAAGEIRRLPRGSESQPL